MNANGISARSGADARSAPRVNSVEGFYTAPQSRMTSSTMRIDPYNSRNLYLAWKVRTKDGIPGVARATSKAVLKYLNDMEHGVNVAKGSRKGPRSYIRVNTLRSRLVVIARMLQDRFALRSIVDVSEEQIHAFFRAMRNGDIRKQDGGKYRSTGDYVKVFRSFWHWHMKVQRKLGKQVRDVCEELDDTTPKPPWVYLTEAEIGRLCDHATFDRKALILFLFDSGIRAPTELVNVRVGDLSDDYTQLTIRDESSKTFGRTIKLMLCAATLRDYVQHHRLSRDDSLFDISAPAANRYLRRLALRILGDDKSPAGGLYADLTMYDFRHSAACYWLPRYKSEAALKYRFGWKRSEMIHYYTEFLGMKDTITEQDLLIGGQKTQLERRLECAEREKHLLEEQLQLMRGEMQEIQTVVGQLAQSIGDG